MSLVAIITIDLSAIVAAEDADKWNWQDHFGRAVDKDDPIWKMYVDVATAHDGDVIETMNRTMDILLIFAGLFSAVVTALLVQMDQAIQPSEPNAFMAKVLKTISLKQLNPILHTLQPSLDLPSLEEYTEESISTIRITMILWYISLECALFVAGGAVCMKLWLVEYRRSNSKYRSSYHRAMHHQQTYASLRRWYVPEFGDLLGSIMMLDLIPFFFGL
ncbi:hypothetical protein FRC03_011947 [Tulasnella sp. 419]|nr:hypothetical protein FRC03_011947 [Tulasnella sp. 419]